MAESTQSSRAAAPRFEPYGYTEDDFAEAGDVVQFSGLMVVCGSDSCDHEAHFESFEELNRSEWTVLTKTSARLTDGTILYEGYCPEVPPSQQTLL